MGNVSSQFSRDGHEKRTSSTRKGKLGSSARHHIRSEEKCIKRLGGNWGERTYGVLIVTWAETLLATRSAAEMMEKM